MRKVALLDGQTIQALPIAKSLKDRGFYVVLLCDSTDSYGYRTKYAHRQIIVPSTKNNITNFHKEFINLIQNEKFDVLIPLNDYSAKYLSENKKELSEFSNFVIPNHSIFMRGYDKNQLMKFCAENNFPHPKTADIKEVGIEEAIKIIPLPALIKPNETTGARGFALIYSKNDLVQKLPDIIEKYGNCHLQEFIPTGGNQYKVELFIHNQKLINATVIHKIRFYPEKGGSSCFNQTIERKDLVNLCFEVLKKIDWVGFADFDLIEDPRDKQAKIMEINPRIPACIKASFSSGVDFAENIVSCSLGSEPAEYEYKPGTYLRYLGLDILWFLKSDNRFRVKPSWFKGLISSKQFLQDGGFDDLKPLIYGTIGGIFKQLNPRFRAEKQEMN